VNPVFSKQRLDQVSLKVMAYQQKFFGQKIAREIVTKDVPDLLGALSKSQDEISRQQREIDKLNKELDKFESDARRKHHSKRLRGW
jgi:F0F1-type ATP synthase membrane subunit b/b'